MHNNIIMNVTKCDCVKMTTYDVSYVVMDIVE